MDRRKALKKVVVDSERPACPVSDADALIRQAWAKRWWEKANGKSYLYSFTDKWAKRT